MELAQYPSFHAILRSQTHGSSVLTQRLLVLLQGADLPNSTAVDELEMCREAVLRAHPDLVALDNALLLVLRKVGDGASTKLAAASVARDWRGTVSLVVKRTSELVREHPQVATISYSGIVRDALIAAKGAGPTAWVGEGQPGREGLVLAEELNAAGINCTAHPDDSLSEVIPLVRLALVGADSVGNLEFVNKTGTCDLLSAAKNAGITTALAYDPLKKVETIRPPVSPLFERIPLALVDVVITAEMED